MTTKKGIIEAKKRKSNRWRNRKTWGKDTEKELREQIQKQNGLQSANALAELMRRNGLKNRKNNQ